MSMGEWISFGRCMLPGVATAVHWSQCTMSWGKWCKISVQLWLPKWMAHRMSISGLRWDSLAHYVIASAEFSLWSSFFLHAENLEFHGNLSETEPETSHQNSRPRTKFHANCEHRKSLIPHCSTQHSSLWISLQTCNPCWKVLTHNLNLAHQRLLKSDADIHGRCKKIIRTVDQLAVCLLVAVLHFIGHMQLLVFIFFCLNLTLLATTLTFPPSMLVSKPKTNFEDWKVWSCQSCSYQRHSLCCPLVPDRS